MKIVHLCLCGLFGEKYAYQDNLLTKYHKKMGNEVTIIAPTASKFTSNGGVVNEPAGSKTLDTGCKLIRIENKFKSKNINKHINLYKDFANVVLSEKPDLIYVHNVTCFNYLCLLKIKKKLPQVKIVFDNHMDEYNSNQNSLSRFLNGFVFRYFVVKRLLKLSNIFYGVTPSRCTFLKDVFKVPEQKIRLLYMGADDEKMDLAHKNDIRLSVRKQYGIVDDDFLIVTGGKIDKVKNIHLLAEAVSKIENPHVKILMFGTIVDELKPIIESLLSDRVIYIGWINSDTVYNYFFAADLVMFPGLHSAMWEQAVASMVPLAVTKLRGFDQVNFNGNCLFMGGKGVDYYKSFVEHIVDDSILYNQLKTNAESEGASKFLYSNIAQKVIEDAFHS